MLLCSDLRVTSGSVLGAALSLSVSTMGAGILTLPSAYAGAGIIPATLVLIGVALLTVYSIDFIVISIEKLGRNSYEELTKEFLGIRMQNVVRSMIILYNIGGAISYLLVVQDLIAPLQPVVMAHLPFLTTAKRTLLFIWIVLMLPLSCVPKLGALNFVSVLAVSSTSLICCMIIFRYFVPGPTPPSAITTEARGNGTYLPSWWKGANPLLAMPIATFAFGCQSIVFQIYANLDDMRRTTMMKVSSISLTLTLGIYAGVGLFGYLSNPVDVRDNIISNYDPNIDHVFAVGYVMYTMPVILAYGIILFPIRDALFFLWYGYSSASVATHVPRRKDYTRLVQKEEKLELLSRLGSESEITSTRASYGAVERNLQKVLEEELEQVLEAKKQQNTVETIPLRDHLIVSVALSTLCVTVALIVPSILTMASLIGGLCGAPLYFILPGVYRWQLHHRNIAPCNNKVEWGVMLFMIVFGFVAMVFGTVVSFRDVVLTHFV